MLCTTNASGGKPGSVFIKLPNCALPPGIGCVKKISVTTHDRIFLQSIFFFFFFAQHFQNTSSPKIQVRPTRKSDMGAVQSIWQISKQKTTADLLLFTSKEQKQHHYLWHQVWSVNDGCTKPWRRNVPKKDNFLSASQLLVLMLQKTQIKDTEVKYFSGVTNTFAFSKYSTSLRTKHVSFTEQSAILKTVNY